MRQIGDASGGAGAARARFVRGFALLSERARVRARRRLALARRIGRPVVWAALHHHCHDPAAIPEREALELAHATWPEGVHPKIHYSTPKTAVEERRRKVGRRVERSIVLPPLRAHADLIDPIGFARFLHDAAGVRDFDVMLEAKAKDLALLRLREELACIDGGYPARR